uniref:Uncharacterized protein n=1 Tax=Megaselia scalaris TaxID=36166 RepID=T1GL43_MEGSC
MIMKAAEIDIKHMTNVCIRVVQIWKNFPDFACARRKDSSTACDDLPNNRGLLRSCSSLLYMNSKVLPRNCVKNVHIKTFLNKFKFKNTLLNKHSREEYTVGEDETKLKHSQQQGI